MGLKLMVEKGDKILVGDDMIITVMALGLDPNYIWTRRKRSSLSMLKLIQKSNS